MIGQAVAGYLDAGDFTASSRTTTGTAFVSKVAQMHQVGLGTSR
jgi:hypothetical protein